MPGLRFLGRLPAGSHGIPPGGIVFSFWVTSAALVAALFGPGADWSGERLTIAALIPLGAALERARVTRGSPSGPSVALGASMTAGALGGLHGAALVAPFVALSGLRSSALARSSREAAAHTCAALAFGAAFWASQALSVATEWPLTLLPGAVGAALAAWSFTAADRLGVPRCERQQPAHWEGAAFRLAMWMILGVMATGIAAVSRALGPAGVALFAMPSTLAQTRWAQAAKESQLMERALNAMRRQIELAEARAAQDLRALERLAAAVDERCYGDPDRSRRVGELAVALLREIPLDEGTLSEDELYRAALLRDIALLRVPEHILRSPGALAPDERLAIMAHPEDGFWFLADHGLSDNVRQIVRGHHERYDGGGYPRRLRSLSIPLGARVLAVADALVAMLSARAYRDALPLEMALQELRLGRGTQFDPTVVDACLTLVQGGGIPWLDRRTSAEARRIA